MQKVERVLRDLAAGGRHGALTRKELLSAGLSPRMIETRVRDGSLVPAHRGVYLLAAPVRSPYARHAAALLACRPRALLSHRTAAHLSDFPVPPMMPLDVTVVARSRRPLPGVRTHSISHLAPAELHRRHGLPVTSPSLTLLDIAGLGDLELLTACLHEARLLRVVTDAELHATLAAHPHRSGARVLRRLLEREGGVRLTRSEAERRLLRLMRAAGLEPDASDHPVGHYVADFWFERERVAVEYDSRQFHENPSSFVSDRRRAARLAALGVLTFPVTAHDLAAGAERAMGDLRATLARRR